MLGRIHCSYVLGAGLIDKSELYLRTNGFDLIPYSVRLTSNKQVNYSGRNANIQYNNIQDLINCPVTDYYENMRFPQKATRKEWIDQLKNFENQKENHLKRFADYVCLISLESIHKVGMIWGDLHKLEMYGLESDFKKNDFSNLNSWLF